MSLYYACTPPSFVSFDSIFLSFPICLSIYLSIVYLQRFNAKVLMRLPPSPKNQE